MSLTQHLVDAAIALLEQRFANESGIAAAMATEDGSILTGVSFQPEWGGGGLCAETGPICEAAKLNARQARGGSAFEQVTPALTVLLRLPLYRSGRARTPSS